jgi:hypothetical protein
MNDDQQATPSRQANNHEPAFLVRMIRIGHGHRQRILEYRSRLVEAYPVFPQVASGFAWIPDEARRHDPEDRREAHPVRHQIVAHQTDTSRRGPIRYMFDRPLSEDRMMRAAAPSSSLAAPLRLASADLSTAKDIAVGLAAINPRLRDPSTDVVTEIENMPGTIANMFATRFGGRDIAIQQSALQQLLSELFAMHDGLDELSQDELLKIQALMDRRSKLMVALSNILKQIGDTSSTIISNMK